MRKKTRIRNWHLILFLTCLLSCGMASSAFAENDWKVSASANYETGKYGTDARINTLYIPVTIKRYFDAGDISMTVPYITQESNGQVTMVNGRVFKRKQQGGMVTTNSGPGDIILKGSFYVMQEHQDQPFDLYLIGKIKLPTGDADRGLGTGKYDETIGFEFSKFTLSQWTVFLDAYYTFIGSPAGTDLKNIFSFDIGFAEEIAPDITASIFYEESTPIISGNPDLIDIFINLEYKVSKEFRIFAGGLVGLTDSSPDYGLTGGFSVRFN